MVLPKAKAKFKPFTAKELDAVARGRYGTADRMVQRLVDTVRAAQGANGTGAGALKERRIEVADGNEVLALLRQLVARLVAWESGESPEPSDTRYVIQPVEVRWLEYPDLEPVKRSANDWLRTAVLAYGKYVEQTLEDELREHGKWHLWDAPLDSVEGTKP